MSLKYKVTNLGKKDLKDILIELETYKHFKLLFLLIFFSIIVLQLIQLIFDGFVLLTIILSIFLYSMVYLIGFSNFFFQKTFFSVVGLRIDPSLTWHEFNREFENTDIVVYFSLHVVEWILFLLFMYFVHGILGIFLIMNFGIELNNGFILLFTVFTCWILVFMLLECPYYIYGTHNNFKISVYSRLRLALSIGLLIILTVFINALY